MIERFSLSFAEPLALVLLALLPLAGLVALAGSAKSTRRRRTAALALRCVVLSCLVFSLSGVRLGQASERIAVVFLVDASDSVGADGRETAQSVVNTAITGMPNGDQAAVVLFGEDAVVERAMGDSRTGEPFRSEPRGAATDIAGAVRLALALFPDGAAPRIVVVSDGEENRGDLEAAAMMAAANDVQISTLGLERLDTPEVLVSDVQAPARARAGDTFEIQVRVNSSVETAATLRLLGDGAVLKEESVQLRSGENTFAVSVTVPERGFRTFTASVSTATGGDTAFQNNELSAFTDVAGPAAALILEGTPGEGGNLAGALEAGGLQVTVLPADQAPTDLPAYASYDATLLVNVPAATLGQKMLTLQSYVRDLGRGLITVGGDSSYGLGGYFNTPLEETLPVRMDIQDPQNLPQLSVDFTIDKSGSMGRCHGDDTGSRAQIESGLPKTDLAKEATYQAIQLLGPSDEVGIVAFDDEAVWIAPTLPLSQQPDIASALAAIQPEGGTNIYAGLSAAVESLIQARGRIKHIILITDGWSNTGDFDALLQQMADSDITLSIIGAGGGAAEFLQGLADRGGGRFYAVSDPHEIPSIFLKETKLSLRAYIVEGDIPLAAGAPSQIMEGISAVPHLNGYVSTTPKATAQTVLLSDRAEPILTQWQYGLGRSVAWTSDAKSQWASDWVGWADFSRFWTQTVRWAAAAPGGDVEVGIDRHGGGARVTVDSADPSGAFRNDLATTVSVLGPDGTRQDVQLEQEAPGRYSGELGLLPEGAYLLGVTQRDGPGGTVVAGATSGLVVGYSPEYGPRSGDGLATLDRARQLTGGFALDAAAPEDAFTHDLPAATVQTPLWPFLVLLALLLLPIDVAVRRLNLGSRELAALRHAIRRPGAASTDAPRPTGHTATLRAGLDRASRVASRRDRAADEPPHPRSAHDHASPEAARRSPPTIPSPPTPSAPVASRQDLLAAKRRAMKRGSDATSDEGNSG